MRPAVEQAIREHALEARVRLVGALADVRPWLAAADAFALPSASEGMSNSLLEAMAAALPIVTSDVPGNAAVVTHDRHALLCEPGDGPGWWPRSSASWEAGAGLPARRAARARNSLGLCAGLGGPSRGTDYAQL